MRRIGKWLGITLSSLFALALVAATGLYLLIRHV